MDTDGELADYFHVPSVAHDLIVHPTHDGPTGIVIRVEEVYSGAWANSNPARGSLAKYQ